MSFLALAIAAVGLYSATPPFWPLPTAFLRGRGAAGGIALINAVGNLGGFVGPYLMGWMRDVSGSYSAGIGVLAAAATMSGLLVLTVKRGRESNQAPFPRWALQNLNLSPLACRVGALAN